MKKSAFFAFAVSAVLLSFDGMAAERSHPAPTCEGGGTITSTYSNFTVGWLVAELKTRELGPLQYTHYNWTTKVKTKKDLSTLGQNTTTFYWATSCTKPDIGNYMCAGRGTGSDASTHFIDCFMPINPPEPPPPPPPAPMCQVNVPPMLSCRAVSGNFADFSTPCTYQAPRTDLVPC